MSSDEARLRGPSEGTTSRWKVDKDIELYRFYLDVSVKAAVFLMTVTGVTTSYVLASRHDRITALALLFPALIDLSFAVLFFSSIPPATRLYREHQRTCAALGVADFDMRPLGAVCTIFGIVCGVAGLGLLLLTWHIAGWAWWIATS